MAMPSSGTITFSQLQTEFGGANPIGINEYYKGGTYVPNISANASVPTSGAISMSNFYSAMTGDVTPNAINWPDVTGTRTVGTTSTQTLTGITVPIILQVIHTGDVDITFSRSVNGGARVAMVSGDTFTVNNNDTINFRSANGSGSPNSCGATIKNTSDTGSPTIDTINFTHP